MITEIQESVNRDKNIKSSRKAYLKNEIAKMATKSAGYQAEIDAITAWEAKVNPELAKIDVKATPVASKKSRKK